MKKLYVTKAIASAKSCIHIFEKEYPNDKRQRLSIQAAEAWLANPTKEYKTQFVEIGTAIEKVKTAYDALTTTRVHMLEVPLKEVERLRGKNETEEPNGSLHNESH